MYKYDKVLMNTAIAWSEMSYCKRSKVGSVLVKDSRIMATGYNGNLPGKENNCEDEHGNTLPCVSHSEQNMLMFAAKNGISTNGCSVYVTLSPCSTCAQLMIQAGITEVVFLEEYRDRSGIHLLIENNVKVRKYEQ